MKMYFALFKFIFPLKEKIYIKRSKNIYLDNLRSENEINSLAKFLKERLNLSQDEYKDFFNIKKINDLYKDYFIKENITFNKKYTDFEFIASIWVVIRIEFNETKQDRSIP